MGQPAGSAVPVPIPRDLALLLSASVQRYPSDMMVTNGVGTDRCGPWVIDRAIRDVRDGIDGLLDKFSFHDLRHYLASLLIASGADIKTVQARMRHATAGPHWTPMAICGPTPTSRPARRSAP
jgi:integrase